MSRREERGRMKAVQLWSTGAKKRTATTKQIIGVIKQCILLPVKILQFKVNKNCQALMRINLTV